MCVCVFSQLFLKMSAFAAVPVYCVSVCAHTQFKVFYSWYRMVFRIQTEATAAW